MKQPHLIITGGHHNSALVVAKALRDTGAQVSWLGHRQAARGDQHDSAEYTEVTAAAIPFYNLKAGKLDSVKNFSQIPFGLFEAKRLLKKLSPTAIFSFGSYLGLTVALAAKLRDIPVFLHEQTVVSGKANRFAASFAKRIYLTWASSRQYFPATKSLLVGLPLRASLLKAKKQKLFTRPRKTLLLLGGKQGSHLLNQLIFEHLRELLSSYNLIHQTGTSSTTGDYQKALALKDSLPAELAGSYRPEGYIGENEIGHLLKSCDLYLGRSGAHVSYELGVLGINSVLIPFPHTNLKEQVKNARYLVSYGLATLLPQKELSYHNLQSAIRQRLPKQVKPLPLPRDATANIINDLLSQL